MKKQTCMEDICSLSGVTASWSTPVLGLSYLICHNSGAAPWICFLPAIGDLPEHGDFSVRNQILLKLLVHGSKLVRAPCTGQTSPEMVIV